MSVSLKKPSDKSKVDLSKPVVKKLPECTPVHLIDEEETMKPCSPQPKIRVDAIRFHHSEEDREIWDLTFKLLRREKLKRVFTVVAVAVAIIVFVSLIVIFVCNFNSFAENLPKPVEVSDDVSFVFDTISSFLAYMLSNPIVIMIICATIAFSIVKQINNITK